MFKDRKKAEQLVAKENNRIKEALAKGFPLPKPIRTDVDFYIGGANRKEKEVFKEMLFERAQKRAGISPQFSEYLAP